MLLFKRFCSQHPFGDALKFNTEIRNQLKHFQVIIHETDTVLNINERIISLAVAPLGTSYDLILIGTTSSILAYDVQKNTNIFRKDIADGVSCIEVILYSDFKPTSVVKKSIFLVAATKCSSTFVFLQKLAFIQKILPIKFDNVINSY